jgi:predicted acyltransferase
MRRLSSDPPHRLQSLDLMRGVVIVGMILANFSINADELQHFRVFPSLLHSRWAGFTLADFVFPAFIFMVGVAIAARGESHSGLDANAWRKLLVRTLRLLVLGFLLGNLLWVWKHDLTLAAGVRLMGVLQRIAICYFFAVILYRLTSVRTIYLAAMSLLLLYWPLTLVPIPGGMQTDLHVPGMNFVAWFDREVLGPHLWVEGPVGYDPEGLLSTLPAIGQCLLGVAAGHWFIRRAGQGSQLIGFGVAGILMAVAAVLWGEIFPIVKDLWSSSFVLLSTGLAMALLSLIQLAVNARALPQATFFGAFGVNAILTYCLHYLCLGVLTVPWLVPLYGGLMSIMPAAIASLALGLIFVFAMWIPMAFLYRKRIFFRL